MKTETRQCQNCKKEFAIEPDDFNFYEKMKVPAPKICPTCRFMRRSVYRNESTLYRSNCKLCGKSVVTMYHPKSPYTIYCNDCYISDEWDPKTYAQDYDSKRPFFDQLKELSIKVPKSATYSSSALGPNVNSEYSNFAGMNKDCYLCFNASPNNENCAYSRGIGKCRDAFDVYYADESERIYEGINIHKSTGLVHSQNTSESIDSWFLLNCSGVQNCFGCVNLRHKSYCFFNQPLSKEEWHKKVDKIVGSYKEVEKAKERFAEHVLEFPRRENNNLKSVNCSGEFIFESKNCNNCFEISNSEDCKHSFSIKIAKDCYDLLGHGRYAELLLDCVGAAGNRVIGGWWIETSHDVEYSFAVEASEYCLGCDSIKHGSYLILNKQYNKEEYEKIRAQIIKELKDENLYGLFTPPELALFAYNETVGQDNVPLAKEEALKFGFRWQEDIPMTTKQETIKPENIPDHIKDVPDSITDEILSCVECGRNYKIIKAELQMYKKAFVPLPRKCFQCRHKERIQRRGPFMIFDRLCAKCNKPIKTNIAPNRPETVYCEQCYQQEVV